MGVVIGVILAVLGICAIESAIVMWLWNCVIVALFGVKPVTFGLACGIMLLLNYITSLFRKRN